MNYNDAYYFVMRLLKWMDEFFVCVHIYIYEYMYMANWNEFTDLKLA